VAQGTLVIASGASLPAGTSLTIGAGGTFIFDPSAISSAPIVSSGAAVAAVPEPATIVLLAFAAVSGSLAACRRRRARYKVDRQST